MHAQSYAVQDFPACRVRLRGAQLRDSTTLPAAAVQVCLNAGCSAGCRELERLCT